MTAHRILNAESANYPGKAAAILAEVGEVRLACLDRPQLLDAVPWATALVVRLGHRVDEAVFARAPALEVVGSATTALDHIDLEAARRQGVAVLSLQGETGFLDTVPATAEHSWAILLSLLRRIPWAHRHATTAPWDRDRFRGRELAGRVLGVVGLGRVGRKVAGYGLAFGMRVAACDPAPERWVDGVERVPGLVELARISDVLTVHVPLDARTRGLIGTEVLAALPRGGVVVNTSRGAVVDEDALASALEAGTLGGAALDVLQGETTEAGVAGNRLVAMARDRRDILLTPHIGGATLESMASTEIFMARKLRRFYRDADPRPPECEASP